MNVHDAHRDVRGYKQEGTTTTPFDIGRTEPDRPVQLATDVVDGVPASGATQARFRQDLQDQQQRAWQYTRGAGKDLESVTGRALDETSPDDAK